ncbi:hypothetical protein V2G26_002305 [Clonostachys chloroleuca]
MFDGTQDQLQGFVTQLQVYFNYFPVTLGTDERKVTYAHSRLKGGALNWFEPVMREYLSGRGNQRTINIMTSFDYFVEVLQQTFGIQDEKRKAEHEINLLSQKGSCTTFSTSVARKRQEEIQQIFQELKKKLERGEPVLGFGPPTKYEYMFCYANGVIPRNSTEKEQYWQTRMEIEAEHNELHAYHQEKMREQHPDVSEELVIFGNNTISAIRLGNGAYEIPTCMKTTWTHDHPLESWMTCYNNQCRVHWTEKAKNDFFPCPNGRIPDKYTAEQTQRFTYRRQGTKQYAIFEEDLEEYPEECTYGELPAELCTEPRCKVHKKAKIELWHKNKDLEDQATAECNSRIERCRNWKCRNHLEAKTIALELAKYGDDDTTPAKTHLQQHQQWEEEIRQRREQGAPSPTDSEESSDTEEQEITSTDEKEWDKAHSDDGIPTIINELNDWKRKYKQFIPGHADEPRTLADILKWVPKNEEEREQLEQRVNQAKNDTNRL